MRKTLASIKRKKLSDILQEKSGPEFHPPSPYFLTRPQTCLDVASIESAKIAPIPPPWGLDRTPLFLAPCSQRNMFDPIGFPCSGYSNTGSPTTHTLPSFSFRSVVYLRDIPWQQTTNSFGACLVLYLHCCEWNATFLHQPPTPYQASYSSKNDVPPTNHHTRTNNAKRSIPKNTKLILPASS